MTAKQPHKPAQKGRVAKQMRKESHIPPAKDDLSLSQGVGISPVHRIVPRRRKAHQQDPCQFKEKTGCSQQEERPAGAQPGCLPGQAGHNPQQPRQKHHR